MKRLLTALFAITLLLSPVSVLNGIRAEDEEPVIEEPQNSEDDDFVVPPLTYIPDEIDGEDLKHEDTLELNQTVELPSRYSLVDENSVTPVKNQGSYGTCWAFAATASAESTYMKSTGVALDLSELHLSYYVYHSYLKSDALGLITNDGLQANVNLAASYSFGGNYLQSMGNLSNGVGFVSESAVPYSSALSMETSSFECYDREFILTNCEEYSMDPSERDILKTALMENGAVAASFYYDNICYNNTTHSYYASGVYSTNHAVTIVGWDDDYSASNFRYSPAGDGAWIVKNSWGTSWGENGYFYISYYDSSMNRTNGLACQYFIEPTDNDTRIYQYDGCGSTDCSNIAVSGSPGILQGNIYTAQRNEFVDSVGFWTMTADVNVTIKIYRNVTSNPSDGELVLTQNCYIENAGYHTVELNSPVQLNNGETYSVVVQHVRTSGLVKVSYEHCRTINFSSYSFYSEGTTGQSFQSYDGITWTDYGTWSPVRCARIKAYTSTCDHDYGVEGWIWNEDYSEAKVVLRCQDNPVHTATLNASVSSNLVTAQTKTATGRMDHTATVTFDGVTYSNLLSETLPMIESDDEIIGEYSDGSYSYTLFGDYSLLIEGTGIFSNAIPSVIPTLYMNNITKIKLSDGFTSIETGALSVLANVTAIELPLSIETIGESVITENITSVVYKGSLSQWIDIFIDPSNLDDLNMIVFRSADVYYNLNGGSNSEDNPIYYSYESDGEIQLSDPTKTGFVFAGWYLDEDFETAVTTLNENTDEYHHGAIGLYAKWVIDSEYYWAHADRNVTSFTVEDGVTFVPDNAFLNNRTIESITLPDSLTGIGENAFRGCINLTSVHIPENVSEIETDAFLNCPAIETITVDEDNSTYDSRDNCNAIVKTSTNCIEFGCKNTTFPSSVTSVAENAMAYGLVSGTLDIPDTFNSIGSGAFQYCHELAEVSISDSVSAISSYTFYSCYDLTRVFIPSSVTSIGEYAFGNCTSLRSIYIPSSVTEIISDNIYEAVFCGCSNLIIYTGAESAPEGWGPYWNYLSGNSQADVVYGVSYEEYLAAISREYTISFDMNGGSGSLPAGVYRDTDTLPEPPERRGYDFVEWNTAKIGIGISIRTDRSIGTTIDSTAFTVYAKWQKIDYTITCNLDGGELPTGKTNPETYNIDTTIKSFSNPVKQGYTFAGYYNDSNKKVTAIKKGSIGDLNLTARWTENSYRLAYNANGGKGTLPKTLSYKTTSSVTVTDTEPTRTGYTFLGWSTNKKATEADYTEGQDITAINGSLKSGSTVTLYAVWKANTYQIVYESEEYGYTSEPIGCTYDVTFRLNKDIFTRPGYYVSKWTYTDTKGKSVTVSGTASVKNLTATDGETVIVSVAKSKGEELWSTATYTITYNLNGGTQNPKNKKSYTMGKEITLYEPTRKGYIFTGWTDEEMEIYEFISSEDYGNKVFTGGWLSCIYAITLDVNEGTLPEGYEEETIFYTVEDTVTLPVPTRANYTFAGWYNGKTKVTAIKKGTINDMTLTAKWTEGTNYTIVYDRNDSSATGKMSNTKVTAGKNVTLTSFAYKLKDQVFVEWNTKQEGTGISYKNKATILKSNPLSSEGGESITLYAVWDDVKSFTITYSPNCEEYTGTMKNQSMKNSAYKALTANTFKRAGYTFTGWNTAADGSGISYKNKETFSAYRGERNGNVTLYAQWSLNTYKITYKNMKSTDTNPNPVSYTIEDGIMTLEDPSRSGYTFMGWYSDSEFKKKVNEIDVLKCKNFTFYARFTKQK